MPHITYGRILWNITEIKSAKILRMFGESPIVTVPAQINGYPVTELGDYCFAPSSHLPADGYLVENFGQTPISFQPDILTELSGNYIKQVDLPDTLTKLGNYSFYNCRNLSCITFSNQLTVIGSDAFMNCHQLEKLYIRCGPTQKSGLRQMLTQISWDVEVSFFEHPHTNKTHPAKIQASIFYPEYYETYDEIAPAHVFGRKITGEGFRARHSFKDGAIDYAQYDTIFQKACAEESAQTMCRLTLCRLRYPTGLSIEKKLQYESYIKTQGKPLCKWLVTEKQLDALYYLFHQKLLSQEDLQYAIMLAAESGWTEGSASMIRWKQLAAKTPIRNKYEFDDF